MKPAELSIPTAQSSNNNAIHNRLFQSFFLGGFECSSHRLNTGRRLNMLSATQHDRFAHQDFERMREQGIRAARSGLSWPLIEYAPGCYNFSSVLPLIEAARETKIQVIWDICHYGWPEDVDIFQPEFVRRLAGLASAFAKFLKSETETTAFISPINEISFFSWAGGDAGYLNPFEHGRGFELKVQLVRASIEVIEAFWKVLPTTRIVHADPVIHIVAHPDRPEDCDDAEGHRQAQFQAWDMLCGRLWPQLGGETKYLDIIGVNYYSNNQWIHGESPIYRGHPLYRPFREILEEVYNRYHRPLFVAETGIENDERADWLHFVCEEVNAAIQHGTPVEGICLYPILNHPGWDDDRHCHNGLWDYADENGEREMYEPLAQEIRRQQHIFDVMENTTR